MEEDDALFRNDPWVQGPIHIDYGYNVKVGAGVFINFNCVIVDTCLITIGARTLMGPNVSLYSGTHPLDPAIRNGLSGPELGKQIHIGEDCWLGGNVVILPGVTIGRGATIGAGSVVTKVGAWLFDHGPCPYRYPHMFLFNTNGLRLTCHGYLQDVPAFHVAAGNPARIIRRIETSMTEN